MDVLREELRHVVPHDAADSASRRRCRRRLPGRKRGHGVRPRRVAGPDGSTTRRRRELIGEAHALSLAASEGYQRVGKAIAAGKLSNQAAGLTKIIGGTLGIRQSNIALQLAGPSAAAWTEENKAAGERGTAFLVRQAGQMAGGTLEMARNVVSERLLGMPREITIDREVPFRDVPRGPAAH